MSYRFQPHLAATSVARLFMFLLAAVSINAQSVSVRPRVADQPARDSQTVQQSRQSTAQSIVRGRVVYADNGQPMKGVKVVVMTSGSNDPFTTMTNERGEFQVNGLRAGKYYITARGPGVPAPSGFGMSLPGSWSFSNVTAGDYEVTALNPIGGTNAGPVVAMRVPPGQGGRPMLGSRGPSPSRARPRYAITQEQISLVSSDVENLTLTMRGTGRIRGVVEMENGDPLPRDLTLFFEFSNIGSRPARPEPVRVASDGSFLVEDVPAGERAIAAALQSGSDFYVLSATMSGKDLREGISIGEDTEGAPVRVQLSTKFARVAGRVASPRPDQAGIVVVFVPVEPWKQRFRTAYTFIQIAPVGSFSGKVAPGEYLILARRRDQLPPLITPDFIQTLSPGAATVALKADDLQTLELRFDLP